MRIGLRSPRQRALSSRSASAGSVRNLLRLVDGPLTLYLGGIISVVVSKKNQRLGDMAADTLVVREPAAPQDAPVWERQSASTPPPPPAPWTGAGATNGGGD